MRVYEALPLICTVCQTQMRIIAFIADAVRKILWEARNGFRVGGQRSFMGYVGAVRTGVRVRSARRLVTSNFLLAVGMGEAR